MDKKKTRKKENMDKKKTRKKEKKKKRKRNISGFPSLSVSVTVNLDSLC